MIARVIVDVTSRQTDRPFDYKVPPDLEDWIDVGSRVKVPFGRRVLQGFVIGLEQTSELNEEKLREIAEVLDIKPALTPELIRLSQWMSEKYICSRISALLAMLPSALKAKYERRIFVADGMESRLDQAEPREKEVISFVLQKGSVSLETLLKSFSKEARLIRQLIAKGWLHEEQTVKNRLSVKKVWMAYPLADRAAIKSALGQISKNAKKQREVLEFFLNRPEPVPCSDLMSRLGVSLGSLKSLAEKGWLTLKEEEVFRDPYGHREISKSSPLPLTAEQRAVLKEIKDALDRQKHRVFLLHGVTGSGKTEVYLQAIEQCIAHGKEAIVLVPEISLTPQMVERFKRRFGDQVAVLHSRLSHGERYDEWRKIHQQKVKVAIGARSAIFAPFTRLGLIIIDEEHESSYKQEETPKYHAKDVALWRGQFQDCVVLLGSATPSLDSYYLASRQGDKPTEGRWHLLEMSSRVEGRPLPKVHIVDMREELRSGNRSMFSRPLVQAVNQRLGKGEQIVLLLNRRGYSTFVMCRSCGHVLSCPHCDISLTYHQRAGVLRCHYCGYAQIEEKVCPDCQSPHIRHFGTGTQRVEEELARLFPGIRVIRMDMDTTTEKGSHEKWLSMFREKRADVLLGTQMVAKGLDFPYVTLVGVISADLTLHLPDFRSSERTFQLLTQVAGRAGRHHLPGEVIIQTYAPDHYSIACAGNHDYVRFFNTELSMRKQRGYPPFCRLILITLSHVQPAMLVRAGEMLVKHLRELWKNKRMEDPDLVRRGAVLEVLGPVASPIPRIKDRYRFQCMVKYQGEFNVSSMVHNALERLYEWAQDDTLTASADVDPYMMM